MKPAALIFDLDDTLVESRGAYKRALVAVGIDPDGQEYDAARKSVKALLPRGHVAARNRLLYFKAMLERRGEAGTRALLELMLRYERALQADVQSQWQAFGRQAFFERLARQYRLAVLTNENARTQLLKLEAFDPEGKLFTTVVTSEEVGHEKPHPAMFETALEKLALPARKCLVIGNDLDHDVRAARKLKLTAIWSREFEPGAKASDDSKPSLDRLDELERLLP